MEENELTDNGTESNESPDKEIEGKLPGSQEEIPEGDEVQVLAADEGGELHRTTYLPGMYQNWFLDYASYVILERAVPEVLDGLKPVQRRIFHSMYELEDGRYNKVANVIGHTMKYHPHGDASIGDAMVQLGQKDLMIDTQGNWGNLLTGDSAAAPRYIEARLSKFGLDVAFFPKITKWKASYDGRNKEPVTLPVKFPLLLAQGVEGIAVGLASKILPHNFIELIDASIAVLKGEEFNLLPDFPTGGLADFSKYNDGLRGGRVRIRARISQLDKKTLVINEIPFGTTTGDLIDSIIAVSEKGKIKIRKIDDNTANAVEILIHLMPGVSPDQTIDALYAFTYCERSESPNACVIKDGKPVFIGVSEIVRISTWQTMDILKAELEFHLGELEEKVFFSSLLRIFIEDGMYKHPEYENSNSFDVVCKVLNKLFKPYFPQFYRKIENEDYKRLIDKPMSNITRFDVKKADEQMMVLVDEIRKVRFNLAHLVEYTIDFYEEIRRKYAAGRERKTEIRNFESIEAAAVAAATQKLYVNKEEGFAGFSLRKDEFVCECSDIDDIIVFREDGTFIVTRIAEKVFVGKNVIHIDIFKKNDDRTTYNAAYQDGRMGAVYVKRFAVTGIVRDKEYAITKGTAGSKILYFTANENGEAEVIRVALKPKPRLKKLTFDFDFAELAIKGRSSQGNILSRNPVKKIIQAEKGYSTLGARDIWYDDTVMRINTDERGKYLGAFKEDDRILTIMRSGQYRLMSFDLSNHFEEDMEIIEKFNPRKPVNVVYFNPLKNATFAKRFLVEVTDKKTSFLPDDEGVKLEIFNSEYRPVLEVDFNNEGLKKPVDTPQQFELDLFVELMGVKAKGKRIGTAPALSVRWLESLPYEEPQEEIALDEGMEDVGMEELENMEGSAIDDIEEIAEIAEETIETEEPKKPRAGKPKKVKEELVIPPKIDEDSIKPPPDFPDDDDDGGTPVQMTLF
ncbi:MAG: DNA gyrase/topoisomerase IV subunit A [Bacteroidetes bacterium]|nr:DNA gyrase/topoisomerase IV subunit A [Bacteroidota bacterium]